ncbi:hypothetical protein J1614_000891 [Plenodomus biglobosus]|nr:hypothetical protein J1614_000891 [Plenodomus biglobosus]
MRSSNASLNRGHQRPPLKPIDSSNWPYSPKQTRQSHNDPGDGVPSRHSISKTEAHRRATTNAIYTNSTTVSINRTLVFALACPVTVKERAGRWAKFTEASQRRALK